MSDQIMIGEISVTAMSDGISRLPRMFYPGLDFDAHPEVLDQDGTVHIPTGCFLIRTADRTILVDAGLGPRQVPFPDGMPGAAVAPQGEPAPLLAEGGALPRALRAAGCAPDDIDTVFLTHLHPDHVGWVAPDGVPYFSNARVVFGEADWAPLIDSLPADDPFRLGMEAVRDAGRTESITGDMLPIAPGVTARHAPGHTPGQYVLVISSADDRGYLLGDAVQCPLQLTELDITFLSDVDPHLAKRTRETLLMEIEAEGAAAGMDHFPGLEFQRIMRGQGRRWVTA